MSKITTLFQILFILTLLWIGYVLLVPPSWVIDKQLAAFHAGDIHKAYAMTSNEFQKNHSFSTFKNFVQGIPTLSNSSGLVINEETIDKDLNNALVVRGFLRSQEGKQIPIEYTLVRSSHIEEMWQGWKIQTLKVQEEGEWKILTTDIVQK